MSTAKVSVVVSKLYDISESFGQPLGVPICVLHFMLLPHCLSSRHEQQMGLLEMGLYMEISTCRDRLF